jgi:hypothetical protein
MRGASMGHITDVSSATLRDASRNHCGDRRVQATRHYAAALRPVAARAQTLKLFKFRAAGRRLAATEQPKAGPVLEPARPETACDAPRGLTSKPMISEPDEESWDFDGHG